MTRQEEEREEVITKDEGGMKEGGKEKFFKRSPLNVTV